MNRIVLIGDLIFEDKDLSLDTQFIVVQSGGRLFIGSDGCPFRSNLTITLFGQKQARLLRSPDLILFSFDDRDDLMA